MKKEFTTGDIAKICKVTINTIVKWFDNGEINGYRKPYSRARRIPREDLLEFLKKHEFPIDEIALLKTRILVFDNDEGILSIFRGVFAGRSEYEVKETRSEFEAGFQTRKFRPHVIFMRAGAGYPDVHRIARLLRKNRNTSETVLIPFSDKFEEKEAKRFEHDRFMELLTLPLEQDVLEKMVAKHTS